MKKKFLSALFMVTVLFTGALFTSCSDDDDDTNYDYDSTITFDNVATVKKYVQSGIFKKSDNTPILPGESVSFKFYAGKGQSLMFATMYGNSNDVFFAPENPGIGLFNEDGTAVTGDLSDKIRLWDNGTRINQVPGPNVTHPGATESRTVTMFTDRDPQGNTYVPARNLMSVMLAYDVTTSEFTATISNISGGTANETPFSPGVFVISNMLKGDVIEEKPLFNPDSNSSLQLSKLAEEGNPQPLFDMLDPETGIITTLSPAVVVVYTGDVNPIYELGKKDAGIGLKELAEKGETSRLKAGLEAMANVKRVYIVNEGKSIHPGENASVSFNADRNDKLAFATMFGYSNDWFFSNSSDIDAGYKGDLTSRVTLLDNGTALNQYPGAGNRQAMFTYSPITESNPISVVGTTYPVPAVSNLIKVSIR